VDRRAVLASSPYAYQKASWLVPAMTMSPALASPLLPTVPLLRTIDAASRRLVNDVRAGALAREARKLRLSWPRPPRSAAPLPLRDGTSAFFIVANKSATRGAGRRRRALRSSAAGLASY
jgi:hypothetical protein